MGRSYFFLRYFYSRLMRRVSLLIPILVLVARMAAFAQAVNAINFNHWYDPLAEVVLQFKPVNHGDSIEVFYRVKCNNAIATPYLVKWERRESYAQRQGTSMGSTDTVTLSKNWMERRFVFNRPAKPWLLVVRLSNVATGKTWHFYRLIEAHHPVNGYLDSEGKQKQWDAFVLAEDVYTLHGSGSGKPIFVSFYADNFPTPAPPFVVKELKMDKFLFPDSTFIVMPGATAGPFKKEGLYLAQEDTSAAFGFSFYVRHSPYPKYNKLTDLKGPLLFVTTREENAALEKAGEDKASFDKVILDITKDKDRARTFMRNYFRRIELANLYFTSFKEGWKTDRGMIFTIFGLPDEVNFDGGFEYWSYKNPRQAFRFARAGSVYHPEHSVLVREKGYTEYWYQAIDLWRKSRY